MDQEYIGSYKILEKKGAGGMAQVYLAVHQDVPNLKVILKVLSDPRLRERFTQEADKLALLDGHASICRIKHFFSHGENIVIAMEYIDGITLEDRIAAASRLDVKEAVKITSDVLDILAFAHQKDIFHRDIKPGNIMIDKSGQTKVIDFGIAKGKEDPNLTIAGTACGTPAYMAPEQFNPTADADYALWDIYAVGTTLFMMITGEGPFKGDNPFAIRDAKMFNDPPKPRDLNPDIPKPLEEIILKSLARDTAQRYQTADQMRSALSAFMPDITPPPATPTPPSIPQGGATVEFPPPTAGKSRKLLWGVAGVAVVLAAVVGYLFWPSEDRVSPGAAAYADGLEAMNNGDFAAALGFFETAQERDPSLTDAAAMRDSMELLLAEETQEFPPMGILEVSIAPSGDLYVDDSLLKAGTDAWMVDLDTGRHVVRVENRRATRKVYADTFSLAADSTERFDYRFHFPPPPEKKFDVRIATIPPLATVFIDNQRQANLTPYTYPLKKGEHNFRVVLETGSGESVVRDSTLNVVGDTLIRFQILTN